MSFIVFIFCYYLLVIVNGDQCAQQTIINDGSDITDTCTSDNCAISISGWDSYDDITLNILCPYSNVYCSQLYGSHHDIHINCYKCEIDVTSCTRSSRNISIDYDTEINDTDFRDISNCQCSAINECQAIRTNNICINSRSITIGWINDNDNDQYIQCQRKCYHSSDCIYGIYYSYNGYYSKCYFITAGCNVYDYENNKGSYYFVSKACMTSINGSFQATSLPSNSTLSILNTFQILTIIFGIIIIIAILALIEHLCIKRKKKVTHSRTTQNDIDPNTGLLAIGSKLTLQNGQIAIIQAPEPVASAPPVYNMSHIANPLIGEGAVREGQNIEINMMELERDYGNTDNGNNGNVENQQTVVAYEYDVQFSILRITPKKNQPTGFNCIAFLAGFILMNVLTDYHELYSLSIIIFWYFGLFGSIFGIYLFCKWVIYYRKIIDLRIKYQLNDEEEIHCFEEDINSALLPKYLIFIEIAIRIIVRFVGLAQCILIPVDLFGMPFTVWITFMCCIIPDDPIGDIASMVKFPLAFHFRPNYTN